MCIADASALGKGSLKLQCKICWQSKVLSRGPGPYMSSELQVRACVGLAGRSQGSLPVEGCIREPLEDRPPYS